jgi:hemerythrin superfamily protein
MTTTTPRMRRRTTERFLNGLSRRAYVIILPGFTRPRGGRRRRRTAFLLTYMTAHKEYDYIMSMSFPPPHAYPSRPLAGADLDATALLARDHEHLRRLLEELAEAAAARALDRKKALFRAFKEALHVHATREEEVFYPAVMKLRSTWAREAVKEALEEHQAVDSIVAEIDQMDPEDSQYDAKVEGLRASVEHHIGAEERAMFAEARNHLTDDRLQALGRQMMSLRDPLPGVTPEL